MHALLTRAISSATLIMFLTLKVFAHELGEFIQVISVLVLDLDLNHLEFRLLRLNI